MKPPSVLRREQADEARETAAWHRVPALDVTVTCLHEGCTATVHHQRAEFYYRWTPENTAWHPELDPHYCASETTITHGEASRTFLYRQLWRGEAVRWIDDLHRAEQP